MRNSLVEALPRGSSDADRILAYSMPVPHSGCWIWMGSLCEYGYGKFRGGTAHKASYTLFKCDVPDGLDLDHLCGVRCCVNPDHLEAVTHQVNVGRGETGIVNRSKTVCPKGHEYSPDNTYISKGKRYCRECVRAASRRWKIKTGYK